MDIALTVLTVVVAWFVAIAGITLLFAAFFGDF